MERELDPKEPGRGAWDEAWTGWWGDEPPYQAPVFVLSHHPREPVAMQGGTTFTFVTDAIESALAQAREAAGDGDVAIAGVPPRWTSTSPRGRSTTCASRREARMRRAAQEGGANDG